VAFGPCPMWTSSDRLLETAAVGKVADPSNPVRAWSASLSTLTNGSLFWRFKNIIAFSLSLHPATEHHYRFKRLCSLASSIVYFVGAMPPLVCAMSCDAPKTASKPIASWHGRLARSPNNRCPKHFFTAYVPVLTAYPANSQAICHLHV